MSAGGTATPEPVKAEQPEEPVELPEKPVDGGEFLGEGGESEIGSDDPEHPDYHDSHADQPDPEEDERMDPHDVTYIWSWLLHAMMQRKIEWQCAHSKAKKSATL